MSGIRDWVTSPWGVKPKAGKVNENSSSSSYSHSSPPQHSSSPSLLSKTKASSGINNSSTKNFKHDVWDELTQQSKIELNPPSDDIFVPNNPIEDALKVSYKKELSPNQEIHKKAPPLTSSSSSMSSSKILTTTPSPPSSSYSSASHLNSKKKSKVVSQVTPKSTPISFSASNSATPSSSSYSEGSKLKFTTPSPNNNLSKKPAQDSTAMKFNKQSNEILHPTQIRKIPLSQQLNTMKAMIDDESNDSQFNSESSNVSKNKKNIVNENVVESETDEDYDLYHSDDESDPLRSLPTTTPYLNTELSGDFETEYEENDALQDLFPTSKITKKPSSGGYSGNSIGVTQKQPLARKVRSQSPYEIPQTIKVSDDSEDLPVSKQKRPTPEKPNDLPLSQPQLQQLQQLQHIANRNNSPASISEPRSGNELKEKKSLNTENIRMTKESLPPPPPPPPQPAALLPVQSPAMSRQDNIEFDNDLLIDRNEVVLVQKIGEGFFGEVWKAKWNHTQDIAVKKMKHEATNPNDRNTFFSEVYSLAKLRHPNITIFYGVTSPPDALIISELLSGSLFQLIHGYKNTSTPLNLMFPLPVILRILRDVAGGGAYLHKRRPPIIHRDLSSSNVLLSVSAHSTHEELLRACADENRPVAKLTDFGLSRNVDWYMTSCVGNLFYLAPEVFSGDHYTQSADVYSFGILIWELVARVSPYPAETPQRAAFLAATRGLRPSHLGNDSRTPADLAFLRDKCWNGDPLERPTFHDISLKLGEMMSPGKLQEGMTTEPSSSPVENSSEGQYSDQFSTVPEETLSHLWDRKCRHLSSQLIRRPKLEFLLQRGILINHPYTSDSSSSTASSSTATPVPTTTPLKSQKKSSTVPQNLAKQRLVAKQMK